MKARLLSLASAALVGLMGLSAFAGDYDIVSRLTTNPGFTYHASPTDWRDVNMYQLFTDRFFDGNAGNNLSRQSTTGAYWYNQGGSNAENDRHKFQGGDWAGIKQKLPYLKDMGVNAIWISGVQMNEQGFDKNFTPYHGYHPSDFYKTEPMFGTFAELKDLIDTAHANGIYVILDVVVNHMADLLKYTDCNCNYEGYCENNCGSLAYWDNNVKFGAPFDNMSWFHNNGNIGDSDWDSYPKYIKGAFLGTEDLKTEDPAVQNALREAFKNLIDATDCDGFRVDAIKHMEYNFIKDWANDMRVHAGTRGKSNFLLFGEYFSYDNGTQAAYCKDEGYSFNSTLWFPMQMTLKNVFAYEQGTAQLGQQMNALNQYGEAKDKVVAFMDNHDVDRFALECGPQWQAKMEPALTFLYLATPVPCLFYGTEHGFDQGGRRNGSPKLGQADFQRENMMNFGFQWGNAAGDKFVASPLYNHIKKLNELRAQYEALRRGTYTTRWDDGGAGLFAFTKTAGDQDALVVFNTAWNTKTANPSVSKPNGTVYVNKLNEADTVTVVDGKLNISVDGKKSKIYVAGQGQSSVSTSCDGTSLTVTYSLGGGPLATPTGSIKIEISHDGGLNPVSAAMSGSGSSRTYTYSINPATMTNVTFWFHDEAGTPKVDDNNGLNWSVNVSGCGSVAVDLAWIGSTYHWPYNGDWDAGEDLWVNVESWPRDAVVNGQVVYTFNGGDSWHSVPMSFDQVNGNNDIWHANLGKYPAGTTVRYAVNLNGRNGIALWDNNNGSDFFATVNANTNSLQWAGNVNHWPLDGDIETFNDLWVNIESWPAGSGTGGDVVYSYDGGATWQAASLEWAGVGGENGNNDWWHANLGQFPAGSTVRYAVKVTDGTTDFWANNGGSNYLAEVNGTASLLRWVGNTKQGGVHSPETGIGLNPTSRAVRVELNDLISNAVYSVLATRDFQSWSNIATLTAGEVIEDVLLSEAQSTNAFSAFALRVDWTPAIAVYDGQDAMISIETWPIGSAAGATIVYSSSVNTNWLSKPMAKTGTRGNNDVWTVSLGTFPQGTWIKYAIQVVDENNADRWDNNGGADFQFQVLDPNQTDFTPPTTGYSPSNLTTAASTLNVTLTATDNQDPSPVIRYTTNGTEPTLSSPVYSSPITVTDQGSGIDMTIKYFAIDASGNQSAVRTLEVRVNHTMTFGGDKPYSTNPTLGKRVPNGSITIDGANNGEWTTNNLIALDMANDDPRSLGDNWTMHEAPIDLTHMWAAWDDDNLYLAWQYVDVTDIIDPANAGGAASGKISSNDGILQWLVLDTIAGAGSTNDMWSKQNYWAGQHKPDYQIYLAGSLWQGYISRAVNGVFPVDDGGVNYKTIAAAGITAAKGSIFAGNALWGVGDTDDRNGGATRNFLTEGHATSRDSFYEIKIPLAYLNLTASQLESSGIGVMIGAGSLSAMDTIPNDPATLDTPGVESYNSSFEWADSDVFTVPFARIGAGN